MLIETFKYKQWADRRTLDAVGTMDENEHPSSTAFARQQLNHMVRVEELFKARLLGELAPHASTNTESVPDLDELDRRMTASNLWFARYIGQLDSSQLNQSLNFQFVDGLQGTMTRREILFHIVNHGTYHRGAIGHALDLAEAVRPADTYTVFIHAVEPSRRENA
ncbi:DinB family protein [Rhizobacter sp. Root1221]|uniref:DinB family protein n=1 Tax=Rhizobacter sp. Root1221 TaxID=1736433 RepID=UPI0006F71751|nr:DinB family protein [Rhizobacter sp. Root1221]KQV97205.1 damage-inducible protein [Rhizobacter sp. Root1221]